MLLTRVRLAAVGCSCSSQKLCRRIDRQRGQQNNNNKLPRVKCCVSDEGSAGYLRKCSWSQHWMELRIPPPPLLCLPAPSCPSLSLWSENTHSETRSRTRRGATGLSLWQDNRVIMSEYFSTDPIVCKPDIIGYCPFFNRARVPSCTCSIKSC